MLNPADERTLLLRRDAAKAAISFFKGRKIKSANNPFQWIGNKSGREEAWGTINVIRYGNSRTASVAQTMENVSRLGIGNCEDKGLICYMSLHGNILLRNDAATHIVQLVGTVGWDHTFCIVSDAAIPLNSSVPCSGLGELCVVVDGWTEDWHFPNLGTLDAFRYGAAHKGLPRALWVRDQIKSRRIGPTNPALTRHLVPQQNRAVEVPATT